MNEECTLETKVGSNNHLYLVVGPTCSGKTSLIGNAVELLGKRAKRERKYTDRPLRQEEVDEKGEVLPSADVMPFPPKNFGIFKGGRSKKDVLFSYESGRHEYGISKSIVEDMERGLDIFLVAGIHQKDRITEILPEHIRERVVPLMILSDEERIKQRLVKRLGDSETLKRSEVVKRQIAECKEHAGEYPFIIFNDLEDKADNITKTDVYNEFALARIIPIVRFVSQYGSSADYVNHLLGRLFNRCPGGLEEVMSVAQKQGVVPVTFDEETIRKANLSWDVAQRLPVDVADVRAAHGRATLVFGRYESWERRNEILKYLQAQAGEAARYVSENADYKRVSAFGLLRALNKETGEPVPEGSGISEGVHDGAVFSLTDFAGTLLPDGAKPVALNVTFVKDTDKIWLDSLTEEAYHASRQQETSRYVSSKPLNRGINGFHTEPRTQ